MPEQVETKPILLQGLPHRLWRDVKARCTQNGERVANLVERALRRELVAGSKGKPNGKK